MSQAAKTRAHKATCLMSQQMANLPTYLITAGLKRSFLFKVHTVYIN